MSLLTRALLILTITVISTVAFRPNLVDRMLSDSDVLLLKTNQFRSFSIDTVTTAKYYWDVPTVSLPMRIEVNPSTDNPYYICINPEINDYDQDILGPCQAVDSGFGTYKLSASVLRKWHGKNLRIYVRQQSSSSTDMSSTIIIKPDVKRSVALGVGLGIGLPILLGLIAVVVMLCKKGGSKLKSNEVKRNKNDKKENSRENSRDQKDDDEKKKKEKKEKKDKKKNNQEDSDEDPETATPNKCKNCKCHKGHHETEELEHFFPSRRFETIQNASQQHSCSVCSTGFKYDAPCRQLYCGHVFHTSCIDNEVHRTNKCPICYSDMSREAIQSLMMHRAHDQRTSVYKPEDLLVNVKQQQQQLQQQAFSQFDNKQQQLHNQALNQFDNKQQQLQQQAFSQFDNKQQQLQHQALNQLDKQHASVGLKYNY